jgi:hypothetical protein
MRVHSDADLSHLFFPGVKVPLTLPDYPLATSESYLASGRKVYRITMSENEIGCISYGWHAREPNPGGDGRQVRWTQKEACLYLSGDGSHRVLRFRVYAMSASSGVPVSGRLEINGTPVGKFSCPGEGWHEVEIALAAQAPALQLRWILDATWSPAQVFKNNDSRTLGMAMQSVWLE